MPHTRHVSPRNNDVLLLVGTMKGAFILRSKRARESWDVGGPYFPGSAVYARSCLSGTIQCSCGLNQGAGDRLQANYRFGYLRPCPP